MLLWDQHEKTTLPGILSKVQHLRLASRHSAHSFSEPPLAVAKIADQNHDMEKSKTQEVAKKKRIKRPLDGLQMGIRQRLPSALIIGAAKCGTEALKKFLSLHPQIVTAKKEVCYFNNNSIFERGVGWYRAQMPFSSEEQVTLEKSPSYFASAVAAKRVHKLLPKVKLILAVCDPIRRSLSDSHRIYATLLHRDFSARDFEKEVINLKTGKVREDSRILQRSIYAVHLRKWLHYFNMSRFHIVDGEMLTKNPLSELKKIEKYLSIDDYLSSNHLYFDESKGFYCMKKGRQRKCLSKNKGRRHPDINEHVLSALHKFFHAKNEYFFELVGHRFRWS